MATLTVQHGQGAGRQFTVGEGLSILGREAGVTFRLMDESVSRKHCLIKKQGSKVMLTDLASHHGTVVNGMKVMECELHTGDTVKLGDCTLVFTEQKSGGKTGLLAGVGEALEQTEREMDLGKGMETILAGLVGDVKRDDIKKLRKEYSGDPEAMRKRLKQLGWGRQEAERFISELEGNAEDDIPKAEVISVTLPKPNERIVHARRAVAGVQPGSMIRFEGRDYLVVESSEGPEAGTWQCRLKEC